MKIRNQSLVLVTLALAACGGGSDGGGGDAATTSLRTEWYDAPVNSVKKAEGPATLAADGSVVRHGAWTEYFPAASGNGVNWTRVYRNGVWDQDQDWTEFNADGSWRVDSGDR